MPKKPNPWDPSTDSDGNDEASDNYDVPQITQRGQVIRPPGRYLSSAEHLKRHEQMAQPSTSRQQFHERFGEPQTNLRTLRLDLTKWAESRECEELKLKIYAFEDSKNSQEYKNICTILQGKIALAQRIEDAGLMTKRLFKTLILENMKSLKKLLDEKAEQYDKEIQDIDDQCRQDGWFNLD